MANDFTERLRVWQSEGWRIENTRGGHLKLVHPNASYPIFCASTPSDHRARHNVESEMRRSLGISVPKNESIIEKTAFQISNTFRKPKSSSKQKRFVIRYQDVKDDEYEEYIPLYEQTNSKLRADVWRLNYLRARLQNREISLIQVLKKRFKTDDVYFRSSLQSFQNNGVSETNRLRSILRERGIVKIEQKPVQPEMPVTIVGMKTFDENRKVPKTFKRRLGVSNNGSRMYFKEVF